MWFAMVRSPLTGKDEYEEAVGQLSDHAQRLFQMQPQREFAMAAVLGGTSMELLCFTPRPDQARLKRTTQLSVQPFAATQGSTTASLQGSTAASLQGSPAATLLLHLFFSDPLQLGFIPPATPAPFSISVNGQRHDLSSFECLRAPSRAGSSDSSHPSAYLSQLTDGRSVAVKFGEKALLVHEVRQHEWPKQP